MKIRKLKRKFRKANKNIDNAKTLKYLKRQFKNLINLSKIENYNLENGETYKITKKVIILDKRLVEGYFFDFNWKKPQELILTNIGVFINVPRRNKYEIGKEYKIIVNTWKGLTFMDNPIYEKVKNGSW